MSNKASLTNCLASLKVDIVLISETWLKPTNAFNIPHYNIVRKDRIDGKAGVAILVSKNIRFTEITFTDNFIDTTMVCGIKLIADSDLNILSIYRPPHSITNANDWTNIFEHCNTPCIIGGDFNAHSSIWGSYKDDNHGNSLINAVDNKNLVILNNGEPTRIMPANIKSAVDITLASPDVATSISWKTLDDNMGSDHFPILMVYSKIMVEESLIYPGSKWSTKNADWELYAALVERGLPDECNSISAEEMATRLTEKIHSAAQKCFVEKKPFIPHKRTKSVWWDQECTRVIEKRKNALQQYRAIPSVDNFLECKKVMAESKRFLKLKARNSWKGFCNNLNVNTSSVEIWNQVRRMQGNTINNKNCSQECAGEVLNELTPDSANKRIIEITDNQIDHPLLQPFTMNELEQALKKTANTAPGNDSITYDMLYHLSYETKKFLVIMYNKIFLEGEPIDVLKTVKVVPILKPGKPINVCNSYRPLSLLTCKLKLLERMIKGRMEWWIDKNQLSKDFQYGFKKGLSTHHAAGKLIIDIFQCYTRNNYLGAIFLDIENAYNNVDLHLLEISLKSFKFPTRMCRNVVNLYRDRKLYIRGQNNEVIGPRYISHGLPQGSVLSPMLFNIYTADIKDKLTDSNIIQYADDIVVYIEDRKMDAVLSKLNDSMIGIKTWLLSKNFEISTSKTCISVFSRHNINIPRIIPLAHLPINYREEVTYLGFALDRKLTWKSHINKIISRSEKCLNVLRIVCKKSWGADITTSLLICNATVRSVADYGAIFYASASNSLLKRLDILQNKCLRLCLGAMKSTPTEALRAEAQELPWELRRNLLAEKFVLKTFALNHKPLCNSIYFLTVQDLTCIYWKRKPSPILSKSFTEVSKYREFIIEENMNCHENLPYDQAVSTVVLPFSDNRIVNKTLLFEKLAEFEEHTKIYTDGSKNDIGTGCAFLVPSANYCRKIQLRQEATIYTAEAVAVWNALDYILQHKIPKSLILTDSKSVVESLNRRDRVHSVVISEIWKVHQAIRSENLGVTVMWVRGHHGFIHNEKVDSLAKEAIFHFDEQYMKIPYTDLIPVIRQKYLREWNKVYQEAYRDRPTNYFHIYPTLPKRLWYRTVKEILPRKLYITVARLKFNHGIFPAHLAKIGITEDNRCVCGQEGSINHIFFGCELYAAQRQNLLQTLVKISLKLPLNMNCVLSTENVEVYKAIYDFVKATNINI